MQWIITYAALILTILAGLLGGTLPAARAEGTLYFGENGTIRRVNPDGTDVEEVVSGHWPSTWRARSCTGRITTPVPILADCSGPTWTALRSSGSSVGWRSQRA